MCFLKIIIFISIFFGIVSEVASLYVNNAGGTRKVINDVVIIGGAKRGSKYVLVNSTLPASAATVSQEILDTVVEKERVEHVDMCTRQDDNSGYSNVVPVSFNLTVLVEEGSVVIRRTVERHCNFDVSFEEQSASGTCDLRIQQRGMCAESVVAETSGNSGEHQSLCPTCNCTSASVPPVYPTVAPWNRSGAVRSDEGVATNPRPSTTESPITTTYASNRGRRNSVYVDPRWRDASLVMAPILLVVAVAVSISLMLGVIVVMRSPLRIRLARTLNSLAMKLDPSLDPSPANNGTPDAPEKQALLPSGEGYDSSSTRLRVGCVLTGLKDRCCPLLTGWLAAAGCPGKETGHRGCKDDIGSPDQVFIDQNTCKMTPTADHRPTDESRSPAITGATVPL